MQVQSEIMSGKDHGQNEEKLYTIEDQDCTGKYSSVHPSMSGQQQLAKSLRSKRAINGSKLRIRHGLHKPKSFKKASHKQIIIAVSDASNDLDSEDHSPKQRAPIQGSNIPQPLLRSGSYKSDVINQASSRIPSVQGISNLKLQDVTDFVEEPVDVYPTQGHNADLDFEEVGWTSLSRDKPQHLFIHGRTSSIEPSAATGSKDQLVISTQLEQAYAEIAHAASSLQESDEIQVDLQARCLQTEISLEAAHMKLEEAAEHLRQADEIIPSLEQEAAVYHQIALNSLSAQTRLHQLAIEGVDGEDVCQNSLVGILQDEVMMYKQMLDAALEDAHSEREATNRMVEHIEGIMELEGKILLSEIELEKIDCQRAEITESDSIPECCADKLAVIGWMKTEVLQIRDRMESIIAQAAVSAAADHREIRSLQRKVEELEVARAEEGAAKMINQRVLELKRRQASKLDVRNNQASRSRPYQTKALVPEAGSARKYWIDGDMLETDWTSGSVSDNEQVCEIMCKDGSVRVYPQYQAGSRNERLLWKLREQLEATESELAAARKEAEAAKNENEAARQVAETAKKELGALKADMDALHEKVTEVGELQGSITGSESKYMIPTSPQANHRLAHQEEVKFTGNRQELCTTENSSGSVMRTQKMPSYCLKIDVDTSAELEWSHESERAPIRPHTRKLATGDEGVDMVADAESACKSAAASDVDKGLQHSHKSLPCAQEILHTDKMSRGTSIHADQHQIVVEARACDLTIDSEAHAQDKLSTASFSDGGSTDDGDSTGDDYLQGIMQATYVQCLQERVLVAEERAEDCDEVAEALREECDVAERALETALKSAADAEGRCGKYKGRAEHAERKLEEVRGLLAIAVGRARQAERAAAEGWADAAERELAAAAEKLKGIQISQLASQQQPRSHELVNHDPPAALPFFGIHPALYNNSLHE